MSLICLKHYHKEAMKVDHPLLNDAKVYSEKEIELLGAVVLQDPLEAPRLILALRSCLRHMVGRYLANWLESRPYEEDMVAEGLLEITAFVDALSLDLLAGRAILKVASQRIQDKIEIMLNARHLAAPSKMQQFNRLRAGDDPLYLKAELYIACDDMLDGEVMHPEETGDEWKRDFIEALDQLKAADEIDEAILDKYNWGRTEQEIADELGVNRLLIHRRKKRLYQQFLEITE
jgi:hypothetical protein